MKRSKNRRHPFRTPLITHIWSVIYCSSWQLPPLYSAGIRLNNLGGTFSIVELLISHSDLRCRRLSQSHSTNCSTILENFKYLTLTYGVEALQKVYKTERHSPFKQLFDNNPQCAHIVQRLSVWTMSHRTFWSSDQKSSMTIYNNYALTMRTVLGLLIVAENSSL